VGLPALTQKGIFMFTKPLFVASLLFGATAMTACAVEDSDLDYESGESTHNSSTELAETPVVDPAAPLEGPIHELSTGTVDGRYFIDFDECHTFDYLRERSTLLCRSMYGSQSYAGNRNFTYNCTGWWGAGAEKVWFTCY
jgi:hypothetical protein